MLTDSDGNTAKLYDYLPFGEEVLAGQDGRSSLYSSSPDGLGPKFTGQTWDGESSLYWFNVRHMSGAQGRFQGVDPYNAGANPADPQTWNMYAYVGNNPLSYTDPSGMFACATCGGSSAGPVGIAVGAAIDVGVALWGVISHLGYSGPPVPNWSGTAWQLGPMQPPIFNDQPCRYPDDCPSGSTTTPPWQQPGIWVGATGAYDIGLLLHTQGIGRLPALKPAQPTIKPNTNYEGSKQQLCTSQSIMAGAEALIPFGHVAAEVLLRHKFVPSAAAKDDAQDFARDKAIEWMGKSSTLLTIRSWTGKLGVYGGKGIPMSITAKFAKGLGVAGAVLTAYQVGDAARMEYQACMAH